MPLQQCLEVIDALSPTSMKKILNVVRERIATCQSNRKRKYDDEREKDKNLPS